jgi:hypothetical protein
VKKYYLLDENNILKEEIYPNEEQNLPAIAVDSEQYPLPDGLYQPIQFTGSGWISTLTQDEIDILKSKSVPSEVEQLKEESQMNALAIMDLAEMVLGV